MVLKLKSHISWVLHVRLAVALYKVFQRLTTVDVFMN